MQDPDQEPASRQLCGRNSDCPPADKGQIPIEATLGFVVLVAAEYPKGTAQDGPAHSGLGEDNSEEPTHLGKATEVHHWANKKPEAGTNCIT